jgi:hypothetical protein
MAIRGQPLYLGGNDDMPRAAVTRINTTTGLEEAATGLTGLTFKLAATETGAAINAALSKTATEIGATGEYQATFEGADLVTYLTAGVDVYQIFGDAANVNLVVARRVVSVRRA